MEHNLPIAGLGNNLNLDLEIKIIQKKSINFLMEIDIGCKKFRKVVLQQITYLQKI